MSPRIAIVGAGAVGCAAARFLARDAVSVTLLEQFTLDHDRGSSFGSSRIIRRVYPDRFYTALMDAAYPLWEELETDSGESLLQRTGGLFFGPTDHPETVAAQDALDAHRVPYERLTSDAARERFPAFRFRDDEIALVQPDGGILRASDCVRAQARLAVAGGVELRERTRIERIERDSSGIALHTDSGEAIRADRVILTPGPWLNDLLPTPLPLVVTRQTYCHFDPDDDPARFDAPGFPIWIDFGTNFYGFPRQADVPGVKVALHERGEPVHPDRVNRAVTEADREPLRRYCAGRLPGLSSRVVVEKVCLYTNTPDEDFIFDPLPDDPRILVVSGCSGHGFKFSILLGRIAAWWTTDTPLPWNLDRFRLRRFEQREPAID